MSNVIPRLKELHSPDIDLDSYRPDEVDCFGFPLQALFGPSDGAGSESFDILVCTPKWLEREMAEDDVISGCHRLIVKRYDLDGIRRYLSKYAQRCSGVDWEEVARKLGQLGKWEFEAYPE